MIRWLGWAGNKISGMFRIEKLNISVYYQYLITYMVIMMIPVLLALVVFDQATKRLNSEIDASYTYKLEKIANDLDQQWKHMMKMSFEIAGNNKLAPYQLKENAYKQVEAAQEMRKYKSQLLLADEIIYAIKDSSEIYNAHGKYYEDVYFKHILQLEPDHEVLTGLLQHKEPLVNSYSVDNLAKGASQLTMVFSFPISSYNTSTKTGTVAFFISEKAFMERIKNIVGEIDGIAIRDKNQQWLAKWGSAKEADSRSKVFETVAGETGFQLLMYPAHNDYASNVTSFKKIVIVLLSISLIVCLTIAIFFAAFVFIPVRKMELLANKITVRTDKQPWKNEFSNIHAAMMSTIANQHSLSAEIKEQKNRVKHYVLTNLLYRNITPDLLKHGSEAGIRLNCSSFCVFIISRENDDSWHGMDKEHLIQELELEHPSATIYGVDLLHQHYVAAVCCLRLPDGDKQLDLDCLANLMIDRCRKAGILIRIGIGSSVLDLKDMNTSMLEALSAVERNDESKQTIIHFEKGEHSEAYLWHPTQAYMRLIQSIKLGDEVLASEQMHHVRDSIREQSDSWMMEKLNCLDFVRTLLKQLNELDQSMKHHEILSVMLYGEPHEIFQMAEKMVCTVCRSIHAHKEATMNQLSADMVQYVHDNVLDPGFGLDSLAQKFQLSLPAASKLFKEQCGNGFKEYVTRLRIEHAKRILNEGEHSIADVCEKIGYMNVSHFIQIFKKATGLTPAQYKEQYDRSFDMPMLASEK